MVWQKKNKLVSIPIKAVVWLLYKSFLPALPVVALSNDKRRLLREGFSPKYESWITGDKVGLVIAFTSMSIWSYKFFQHMS